MIQAVSESIWCFPSSGYGAILSVTIYSVPHLFHPHSCILQAENFCWICTPALHALG